MCGSFNCSKNTLIGLNLGYVIVAFLLIGVATWAKTANLVTSLPLVGGIAASGAFLLIVALVGLFGAVRHHQVLLFFYMVVLAVVFIIQFSVACACLAVDEDRELQLAKVGWDKAFEKDKDLIIDVETNFNCCGFNDTSTGWECETHVDGCKDIKADTCDTCKSRLVGKINKGFNSAGGLGLFFAFTEVINARHALFSRPALSGVRVLDLSFFSLFRSWSPSSIVFGSESNSGKCPRSLNGVIKTH